MKRWNLFAVVFGLLLLAMPAGLHAQNPNCTIVIPDAPLTAAGLATPYQLKATQPDGGVPCSETNSTSSAFVQAAIFDPATAQISIYNPVVVSADDPSPAVPPVVPTLPAHAIVALWFGFNGNNLTQAASSPDVLNRAHCVNGMPNGNVFSQFSYCNAVAFFNAANQAIASRTLKVPPLGTGSDKLPCPTVRDFFVVDQDQSDNLPVTYLMAQTGQVAQNTPNNVANLTGATVFGNPSDNGLLDRFIDKALNCTPWKVRDLADTTGTQTLPGLALNELQAAGRQASPMAVIPAGDPMARDNDPAADAVGTGPVDLRKLNAYRVAVDQPRAFSLSDADTAAYCRNMLRIAPPRLLLDQDLLSNVASPVPSAASNLFTFMAQRFMASYDILNCGEFVPTPDPVSVTNDVNGAATSATIDPPTMRRNRRYLQTYDKRDTAPPARR